MIEFFDLLRRGIVETCLFVFAWIFVLDVLIWFVWCFCRQVDSGSFVDPPFVNRAKPVTEVNNIKWS